MGLEECDFDSFGGELDGEVIVPVDTITGRWETESTFTELRTGFVGIADGRLARLTETGWG